MSTPDQKKANIVEMAPKIDAVGIHPAPAEKWTPQQWRRFWTKLSFFPFVVLPVLLGIFYFSVIASDRYAAEIKFTIRSPSGSTPTDLLGAFTGVSSSGSTVTDSYIVVDFLRSRELIDLLEQDIDLRAIYDNEKADWWARFDSTLTQEEFADYLKSMIYVYFDTSSQIVTVEVQAFSAEDAKLVGQTILDLSEDLVNRLSQKAREDTLRSAQDEVSRAETLLRNHRKRISEFRQNQQDVDPTKTVEAQQAFLAQIQGQLGAARTQLSAMARFMDADAPSMKVLRSRINALESQLESERLKLGIGEVSGADDQGTLTSRVGAYEELAVDLEFLQQAYVLSLASLERARVEADRQERYLAAFVTPRVPQEAKYPNRILNIFLVFVLSVMGWVIGLIAVYVVREHVV